MKKTLSLQDYQEISAYLDNACSSQQKNAFEKRLANDPDLQSALREFEYTRRLMRAIPVRKAPRNFTLSAAKVPARPQRFFLAPVLNFAATAAAVLLVVVFAGSHLLPGVTSTQMTSRSISPMLASAAEATNYSASSPMIITWNQSGTTYDSMAKGGAGGGEAGTMGSTVLLGGGAPAPGAMLPPPVETMAAPEATSTPEATKLAPPAAISALQPTTTAVTPTPEPTQPTPTETLAATDTMQASVTEAAPAPTEATDTSMLAMAQPSDTSHLILGVPSADEQGKVIATSAVEIPEVPTSTPPAVNFTLIEIVLGSVAILCLALSFLVRRLR